MTGVTVKDLLKKLIELQALDGEIYTIQQQLKERPEQVKLLQEEFESKKSHLNELETKIKNIQVKRKNFEVDLQAKEDNIKKANTQLNDLKTNKEYKAKITEIEGMKVEKSRIEEQILLSYDESDSINSQIEKEKVVVAQEEKNYLAKKKEVDDEIKIHQERINVLDSQRNKIVPDVDSNLMSVYERVLNHKEGLAIAPVVNNDSCGGCYMNINAQMVNLLKMHSEIVQCERCSRILYLEGSLD